VTLLHLDSHVVVWLWAGDATRLRPVWRLLRRSQLAISPVTMLELQFLFEIGRITAPGMDVVRELVRDVGLQVAATPLARIVDESIALNWTRDPFDRLIVAHAKAEGAKLVTRDRGILDHCSWAQWA